MTSCYVTRGLVVIATTLMLTSSSTRLRHQHGRRHSAAFVVDEQLPVGHVVGNMADVVTSQDGGEGRSYSMLGGSGQDLFTIDEHTGIIRTFAVLDRELICPEWHPLRSRSRTCTVSLEVAILPRFDVVTLNVQVVDINDHAPTFGVDSTTRHVTESASVGPAFQLPVAVDQDGGENGAVRYRLEPVTCPFRLQVAEDRSPAELTVELIKQLDRETTANYHLTLTAYDSGTPSLSASLDVNVVIDDVNDKRPQFDPPTSDVTMPASAPTGSLVTSVSAHDADTGLNAEVRYHFAARTEARYGAMFSLDSATGNITTASRLDFTASPVIQLVVLATDLGPNAVSTSMTVTVRAADVNEHTPTVRVQSLDTAEADTRRLSIPENNPVGSFVAHVVATDLDVGISGQVDCRIQASHDVGNFDDAGYFQLVPLYPADLVDPYIGMEYKLVSRAVFDRETRDVYHIHLVCRDRGSPARTVRRQLVIDVKDVDDNVPRFSAAAYNFTVTENNAVGQPVGRVSASDADSGPNGAVVYSLEAESESASWFSVGQLTGDINAKVSFDREFVDEFSFNIVAASASGNETGKGKTGHVTVRVTIADVDDNAARFERSWYRFDVAENQPGGTVVGRVTAVDPDLSPFNSVFYSLDAGPTPTEDFRHQSSSVFVVDPVTGVIYTRRPLDREALSHYTLHVRARSDVISGPDIVDASRSDDVTAVFVAVADVNDNKPEVTLPDVTSSSGDGGYWRLQLDRKSVRAGATVATVTGKDPDVGENARLSYNILYGNDRGLFTIDSDSGVIRWANDSLTLTECPWALTVKVTDHGKVRQLWSTARLTVDVDNCLGDLDALQYSSSRLSDINHVGQFLMTDWHVFIIAVTIAACVVVVGVCLTVVVALRHCKHPKHPKMGPPPPVVPPVGSEPSGSSVDDPDEEVRLKLVATPSETFSDATISSHESVMSAGGEPQSVLVVVNSQQDIGRAVIRALHQHHINVSSLQEPYRLHVTSSSRDADRDSGYLDLSPALSLAC